MKFAIATVDFWRSVGFDTDNWRKSLDGTKALVHLEYARILVPDVETNDNVIVYDCPSLEFDALTESEEWR